MGSIIWLHNLILANLVSFRNKSGNYGPSLASRSSNSRKIHVFLSIIEISALKILVLGGSTWIITLPNQII